jgi:TRAP-type uncharacterized transport system substrate-binding protein
VQKWKHRPADLGRVRPIERENALPLAQTGHSHVAWPAPFRRSLPPTDREGEDREGWPESFTVGTASQGGTYFAYGSGWANLVAEELGLSGGGEVTGGPMQNMALVHTGEAQFGMTTMGPAAESLQGTNPIAPGLQMTGACAMFPMYQTPFSVTALSSSGITSIADIPAGARIGFGPAGSTSDTYFPRMMEELGVNFERRNGGWSDLGGQLQDGLLDVIAFAAGVPVPAVSQLEVQTDVNIIEFTEEEQATIMEAFPVSPFDDRRRHLHHARGGPLRVDVELRHRQLRPAGELRLRRRRRCHVRQRAHGEHPPRGTLDAARELGQEQCPDVAPRCGPLVRGERRRGHPRRHDPLVDVIGGTGAIPGHR